MWYMQGKITKVASQQNNLAGSAAKNGNESSDSSDEDSEDVSVGTLNFNFLGFYFVMKFIFCSEKNKRISIKA